MGIWIYSPDLLANWTMEAIESRPWLHRFQVHVAELVRLARMLIARIAAVDRGREGVHPLLRIWYPLRHEVNI